MFDLKNNYQYVVLAVVVLLLLYSFYLNTKDNKFMFDIDTYNYSVLGRQRGQHRKMRGEHPRQRMASANGKTNFNDKYNVEGYTSTTYKY